MHAAIDLPAIVASFVPVQRLLWLPRVVLVCAYVGAATNTTPKPANLQCQLLLYPRYHLDHSSLLARYPLPQVSSRNKLLS